MIDNISKEKRSKTMTKIKRMNTDKKKLFKLPMMYTTSDLSENIKNTRDLEVNFQISQFFQFQPKILLLC